MRSTARGRIRAVSVGRPASRSRRLQQCRARFAPRAARGPSLFGTRVHAGLIVGVIAAIILHIGVSYTRWGIALKVLSGNRKVGAMAGFSFVRQTQRVR